MADTMNVKDGLFAKHQDGRKRLSRSADCCSPALEVLRVSDQLELAVVNTVMPLWVDMSRLGFADGHILVVLVAAGVEPHLEQLSTTIVTNEAQRPYDTPDTGNEIDPFFGFLRNRAPKYTCS